MQNKKNLSITLIIIYLALLAVSIAIYALLQLYVKDIDRGTATNLMIWSATLFPSIALIYTFNFWREQKGSEVLSKLSEDVFFRLTNLAKIHNQIYEDHRKILLGKLLNNIDMSESDNSKELFKLNDIELNKICENIHLIGKYTKDKDLENAIKNMHYALSVYAARRFDVYIGMKVIEETETSSHSIAFDTNDKNEYLKPHSQLEISNSN